MSAYRLDPLLPVIDRIYEAALEPRLWGEVVSAIVDIQRAGKALLFSPLHSPAQGGIVYPVGISESALQQWADRYVQHDLWSQAGVAKGLFSEGMVVTDEELVPHAELLDSVMYREFFSRLDIVRLCTGVVFGTASREVPPVVMAVYRGIADRPFGERARATHRLIVPHLSRALGIMYRLRDAEARVAASLAALDRLASGVLLIGAQRQVCFANRVALAMLADEDGLRLRADALGQSWLAAAPTDAQRALDAAIDQCLAPESIEVPHFSRALQLARPSGRAAYALQVSALPETNEFGSGPQQPRAIAFLTDPARQAPLDDALLRTLYALTPAECRLAAAVCGGEPLAAVAERLGVSENTAKSQLQSVFEKTGTRRQAQLVKLLLSLSSTD